MRKLHIRCVANYNALKNTVTVKLTTKINVHNRIRFIILLIFLQYFRGYQ